MAAYAVQTREVAAVSEPADTASIRVTVDGAAGAEQLIQRVISFQTGSS